MGVLQDSQAKKVFLENHLSGATVPHDSDAAKKNYVNKLFFKQYLMQIIYICFVRIQLSLVVENRTFFARKEQQKVAF